MDHPTPPILKPAGRPADPAPAPAAVPVIREPAPAQPRAKPKPSCPEDDPIHWALHW